jgi:hypothetical protein
VLHKFLVGIYDEWNQKIDFSTNAFRREIVCEENVSQKSHFNAY